jgi:2-aminoadipate transaminase
MGDWKRALLSKTGRQVNDSAIRRMGITTARVRDVVSFAPGYPDAGSFPLAELREICMDLLDGRDPSILQYGPTRGNAALLEALVPAQRERGIEARPNNLLVTTGSQQGIDLVARAVLDPGDVVLAELPTYTGAISAFRNAGARITGVRQDGHGIDVDDLTSVCARERQEGGRVKLLYLTPNFQNPTGTLLAFDRRAAVLTWAERAGVLILEDDPYGSLYFDESAGPAATRPLRADDTGGTVVYLSTFSKTLAPGLRVGWMVGDPELVERCEALKQSIDLLTGALDQRLVLEALHRDLPRQLAPRLRATYRDRLAVMERALEAACGTELRWSTPRGGFFLWATLPPEVDDESLLRRSLARGVTFVAGSAFFVDGTGHDRIRLSYSSAPEGEVRTGATRLAAALDECREATGHDTRPAPLTDGAR